MHRVPFCLIVVHGDPPGLCTLGLFHFGRVHIRGCDPPMLCTSVTPRVVSHGGVVHKVIQGRGCAHWWVVIHLSWSHQWVVIHCDTPSCVSSGRCAHCGLLSILVVCTLVGCELVIHQCCERGDTPSRVSSGRCARGSPWDDGVVHAAAGRTQPVGTCPPSASRPTTTRPTPTSAATTFQQKDIDFRQIGRFEEETVNCIC